MASTGKSFGLKLYIHSMTDNIITTGTSNYIQLLLNEPLTICHCLHIYISKYLCCIKSTAEKKVQTCIELVVKL
jgi:hypothetical protein